MDVKELTAPCGIPCFECVSFKAGLDETIQKALSQRTGIALEEATCPGCRPNQGKCFLFKKNNLFPEGKCMLFSEEEGQCKIYRCTQTKGIHNCSECRNFPCHNLHPLADKAAMVPHNLKMYNLCEIKKVGLHEWAEQRAKKNWLRYFGQEFGS